MYVYKTSTQLSPRLHTSILTALLPSPEEPQVPTFLVLTCLMTDFP